MAISVMTWAWNRSRSRHGARLVLLAIADCASSDGGNAWPSNAELQRKSGLGERAVRIALAELVKLGELEVSYNGGPHGCNRYRVIMDDPGNICPPADNAPRQDLPGSDNDAESPQVSTEDPADNAPPEESAPRQTLPPTPADIAPGTVLEPKPKNSPSESSTARARATRIPDDFAVTPQMADWARAKVPRLVAAGRAKDETDQFIDHWRQSSSPNARKLDWVAAWRTWLRREERDLARQPQQRPTRQQETDDQFERAMRRIQEREERANDPQGNWIAGQVHQISLPRAAN